MYIRRSNDWFGSKTLFFYIRETVVCISVHPDALSQPQNLSWYHTAILPSICRFFYARLRIHLIRLRDKCRTGQGGLKENEWNDMLRICLRQTLRKRNTVEEIGLCGQREVSENRVFADNMPSACVRADSDTLKQSLVYRHIVCLASV